MNDQGTNFWGGHDFCWACRVLEGVACGCIVHEDAAVAVIVNPFPLNPGHVLVVPRRHIENVYGLPDALAGPILAMAARMARVAKRMVAADGITLRQNNDAASDQHLFHFHLHVIPRFAGDGGRFHGEPQLLPTADQEAIGARLRQGLADDPGGC